MPLNKKHIVAITLIVILITFTIYFLVNKEETKTEKFNTTPTNSELSNNSILYTDQNGNLSTWSFSQLMENINGTNNSTIQSLRTDLDANTNSISGNNFFITGLMNVTYMYIKGPDVALEVNSNTPLKILDGGHDDDDSKKCEKKLSKGLSFNDNTQVFSLPIFTVGLFRIKFACSVKFAHNPIITIVVYKKNNTDVTEINRRDVNCDHNYILYTELCSFEYLTQFEQVYFELFSNKSDIIHVTDIDIMIDRVSMQKPDELD